MPSALCSACEVVRQLLRLLVPRVLLAVPAVLAQLETLGRLLPVLRRAVVPALTVEARQRNNVSHNKLSAISSQLSALSGRQLRDDLRYRPRADRAAAFANGEA